MSDLDPQLTQLHPTSIPRREFIRKSVMLSGAAFAGMSSISRGGVPRLNSRLMPLRSATNRQENERGNNGVGNGLDPQPPGDPPPNDLEGTGPGNPGNQGGAHD